MANLDSANSTSLTPLRKEPRLRGFTSSLPRGPLPILTAKALGLHVNHAHLLLPLPVCFLTTSWTIRISHSRTNSSKFLRCEALTLYKLRPAHEVVSSELTPEECLAGALMTMGTWLYIFIIIESEPLLRFTEQANRSWRQCDS
jgi:hypothetical protein